MTSVVSYIKWGVNAAASRTGMKLFSINLEVTKRCNARCDFCDYWKTQEEQPLTDYSAIVKRLDPLAVVLTGGEPLLRRDIVDIVRSLKKSNPLTRISLITNGILLTEQIALSLHEAGLDQLSISLDFLDERHDRNRGHKGLAARIGEIAPRIRARGINLCLNTVIMRDNLDSLEDIVIWAQKNGLLIGFSTYCDMKNMNKSHLIPADDIDRAAQVMEKLIHCKRELGNITNSDFYLRRVPRYFQGRGIGNCQSGRKWVQVTPEGYIKRCSEYPAKCFWTEYDRHTFAPTTCTKCWFACRGESQAPFQWQRLLKYGKILLKNAKAQPSK
ncbi:radical SAM protein [Thermodesulfobacteriota bacterium]